MQSSQAVAEARKALRLAFAAVEAARAACEVAGWDGDAVRTSLEDASRDVRYAMAAAEVPA